MNQVVLVFNPNQEFLMQYFNCLKQGLDTQPFLQQLTSVEGAWADATGRQEKIQVQREALSIPLRGLRMSAIGNRKRRDVHESRWTTSSQKYPLFCDFLNRYILFEYCKPAMT
jgi:hypothetical protein